MAETTETATITAFDPRTRIGSIRTKTGHLQGVDFGLFVNDIATLDHLHVEDKVIVHLDTNQRLLRIQR